MKHYKLAYYVPTSHLQVTKDAVFAAGAGCFGQYDRVCWQVEGQGQFRALPGSQPFLGQLQQLETVIEYRVELIFPADKLDATITTLLAAHPYETPAYEAWPLTYPNEL